MLNLLIAILSNVFNETVSRTNMQYNNVLYLNYK